MFAVFATSHCFAGAGIATDGSVGLRQTIAVANAGAGNFTIPQTLGSIRGGNLFHSFSIFNIDSDQTATFTTSAASITNVISRVTGGVASQINGKLALSQVAGSTSTFFFINPSGVIVGAGGTIDVPGAFHLSTADYLKFSNGDKFFADASRASTLSSVAPEAFGFLGTTAASVKLQDGAMLVARPLQPISIISSNIEVNNAAVVTRGGDIRIVALGQANQEIRLSDPLPAAKGKLVISNGGIISIDDAGSNRAASVAISAGGFSIDGQGKLAGVFADTYSGSNAGNVTITASGSLSIANGGEISSSSFSSGNGGTVSVNAGNMAIDKQTSRVATGIFVDTYSDVGNAGRVQVTVTDNLSVLNGGTISASSYSYGSAGHININAGSIVVDAKRNQDNTTGIFVDTYAEGNGGDVQVSSSGNISIVNGGQISSSTTATGNAGNVTVSARSLSVDGQGNPGPTGIYSDTYGDSYSSTGNAGNVQVIVTENLSIANKGGISSVSSSAGNAGNVIVNAGNISIDGQGNISGIFVDTFGSGKAGDVQVSATGSLLVANGGVISSSTWSPGNAGAVTVGANTIILDGHSSSTRETGIFTQAIMDAGNAGNVRVVTKENLSVVNGAEISSSTKSNGNAGSVEVEAAGNISLSNGGTITSEASSIGNAGYVKVVASSISIQGQECCATGISSDALGSSGNAGSVDVQATGALSISRGGFISSGTYGSGSAGSIKVVADSILIDGTGSSTATGVLTNAGSGSSGKAGNVEVVAANSLFIIDGGEIASDTFAAGNAGAVKVSAGSISVNGQGTHDYATGIMSNANPGSGGNGGTVDVTVTGNLSIVNGGEISSSSGAFGNAGAVSVSAASITVDGQGNNNATGFFSIVDTGSSGNAGSVDVLATGTLSIINGGEISSSTLSSGVAGMVSVTTGSLRLNGDASKISAAASQGSSGQTGTVNVTANDITLSNGGQIAITNDATVDKPGNLAPKSISVTAPSMTILNSPNAITTKSTGNVAAGSIKIIASDKLFVDPSGVTTTSNQGNGGAIDITAGTLWLDNSQIATSVTGLTGNGGDISISATSLVMNTGFIQANTAAANASGGLVSISAQNLIPSGNTLFIGGSTPHTFQPGTFGYNVIQAAAPTGVSGVIQISSPTLDVSASLVGLNTNLMRNDQIARHPCENAGGSSLSSVGRGGLPLTGSDFLSPSQFPGLGFIFSPSPANDGKCRCARAGEPPSLHLAYD